MNEIEQCWFEVLETFNGNVTKTLCWFCDFNPHIGTTPADMIRMGKEEKLLKIIKALKEESKK